MRQLDTSVSLFNWLGELAADVEPSMTRELKHQVHEGSADRSFLTAAPNPSPDASVIVKIRPILELLIESIRGVARVLQCLL